MDGNSEYRTAVALLLAQQHLNEQLRAQVAEQDQFIDALQHCLDRNKLWLYECERCKQYFQVHDTDESLSDGVDFPCLGCNDDHVVCKDCILKTEITTRLFCWYSVVCDRHFHKCPKHCPGMHSVEAE